MKEDWTDRDKKAVSMSMKKPQRPHRLHNHPRMEVELGVSSEEVIVDIEFVHLFRNAMAIRNDEEHFIVHKKEFLDILDSKGGGAAMKHSTVSDTKVARTGKKLINIYKIISKY